MAGEATKNLVFPLEFNDKIPHYVRNDKQTSIFQVFLSRIFFLFMT